MDQEYTEDPLPGPPLLRRRGSHCPPQECFESEMKFGLASPLSRRGRPKAGREMGEGDRG